MSPIGFFTKQMQVSSLIPKAFITVPAALSVLLEDITEDLAFHLLGRPRRKPKKANHGARPNSHFMRRRRKPKHVLVRDK